jgi:hypothetical protein
MGGGESILGAEDYAVRGGHTEICPTPLEIMAARPVGHASRNACHLTALYYSDVIRTKDDVDQPDRAGSPQKT